MKWFDFTFDTPAENLACDEALLDLCERAGLETLRFWESRQPFVVVGYGNRVASEVNVEECSRRGVPILRRCSGGGTVVQGPGCLNYNLTLQIPESGPLTTVTGTNEFVMERNRAAIEKILGAKVSVQGCTDLAFLNLNLNPALNRKSPPQPDGMTITSRMTKPEGKEVWLKFSGNAQRRRRRALVFHGTLLHNFDLAFIDALLRFPSAQPDYRADRGHADFVRNLPLASDAIREALRSEWKATVQYTDLPNEQIAELARERYGRDDWNFRR